MRWVIASVWVGVCGSACGEAAAPPAAPPKPPVEARSSVDRAVATTGDLITYEIVVEHDARIPLTLPDPGDQIAGFRIVDLGTDPPRTEGGRVIARRWYTLRADLVGSYILPPLQIRYELPPELRALEPAPAPSAPVAPAPTPPIAGPAGAEPSGASGPAAVLPEPAPALPEGVRVLRTSEIFVEVKSVLPKDGEATDIHDIKPLEDVEEPWPWRWIAATGALALVVAALLVARRRRTKSIVMPHTPAHEIAFAALEDLRHTDFGDPLAVRRYYFQLSEIVRRYVEDRFLLNATDLTTPEILRRLDDLAELPGQPRHKLEGFLVDTDKVKFADYRPSEGEITDAYERALSFVEETRPAPPVAA